MKNFCVAFVVVMLLFVSADYSQALEHKGRVEQVKKVNAFNKVTDYFATAGKSKVQKDNILKERQEERRIARLKALQRKKQLEQKKLEQEMVQQNKRIKGWRAGSYEK